MWIRETLWNKKDYTHIKKTVEEGTVQSRFSDTFGLRKNCHQIEWFYVVNWKMVLVKYSLNHRFSLNLLSLNWDCTIFKNYLALEIKSLSIFTHKKEFEMQLIKKSLSGNVSAVFYLKVMSQTHFPHLKKQTQTKYSHIKKNQKLVHVLLYNI